MTSGESGGPSVLQYCDNFCLLLFSSMIWFKNIFLTELKRNKEALGLKCSKGPVPVQYCKYGKSLPGQRQLGNENCAEIISSILCGIIFQSK